MPPHKIPLLLIWQTDPGHLSRLILEELMLYAKDKQFYPVQNALFRYMSEPQFNHVTHKLDDARYPELKGKVNTFDWWFGRLVEEGYIEIDQPTRAIRCVKLLITDKPEE